MTLFKDVSDLYFHNIYNETANLKSLSPLEKKNKLIFFASILSGTDCEHWYLLFVFTNFNNKKTPLLNDTDSWVNLLLNFSNQLHFYSSITIASLFHRKFFLQTILSTLVNYTFYIHSSFWLSLQKLIENLFI